MAEYKEIIKEMGQKEEGAFSDMLTEALDIVGLSEQQFT